MAIDYNLLESIIGKDPLYNLYKSEGLLNPENIQPFSADYRNQDIAKKDLATQEHSTAGYTYPSGGSDVSYIAYLDQFGNKPSGPLYGKRIMDDSYLDREVYDTVVTKPGGETRNLTQREEIMQDLKSSDEYTRSNALSDIFGHYTSPEKIANYPDIYKDSVPGYSGGDWFNQPTITDRNKKIAETIGHEARHQLLGAYDSDFNKKYADTLPEGDFGDGKTFPGYYGKNESLNRMLDFQAYSLPNNIYDTIYEEMGMPRNLTNRFTDALSENATAFTNEILSQEPQKETEELTGIETISPRKNWFKRLLDSTLMGRIGNQFAYRPAPIGGAGGYTAAQLDRMNARGGWYSEPAREKRRTINRVKNMMARKEAGKTYSEKNLANLSAQISGGRDPSQGNTVTGHGKSGMGRDPRDRMAYGGLATMFERRR